MKQEVLKIGQIVNTFGIQGMIKVVPYTDDIKRFDDLKTIYVEDKKSNKVEYEIEKVKYHKNMVLLKLKGIDKVEDAEKLKENFIKIDRKDAIDLDKDSYFIVDLIGIDVYTDNNKYLGKVENIYNTGSNDIYIVKNEQGKEILLPGIEEVIKQIDTDNEKIIVHLIKGLE